MWFLAWAHQCRLTLASVCWAFSRMWLRMDKSSWVTQGKGYWTWRPSPSNLFLSQQRPLLIFSSCKPRNQPWFYPDLRSAFAVVIQALTFAVVIHVPHFCGPMDCSPPGSSVHGVFQARILKWVAISFSRGSSWPRIEPMSAALAGKFFTTESPGKPQVYLKSLHFSVFTASNPGLPPTSLNQMLQDFFLINLCGSLAHPLATVRMIFFF